MRNFGIHITCLYNLKKILGGLHLYKLQNKIQLRYEKIILDIVYNLVKNTILKYKSSNYIIPNEILDNNVIWTFWWQGELGAPESIQMCLNSIRKNANGKKVIVIDQNNYTQYVEFTQEIMDSFKNGIITVTHFSDLLRMNLLSRYGGVWLDATIILVEPLKDDWFTYDYYTAKQNPKKCVCISEYRWSGSFICGKNNNPLFHFVFEAFCEYWSKQKLLVDYFLIDYVMEIAYRELDFFKEQLDTLAINNTKMYDLQALLNKEYEQNYFESIADETIMFKLQRRKKYFYTKNNQLTFYGYLLKCNGRKSS